MSDHLLPGVAELSTRIANLERQCHLLLYLSGVNVVFNAFTIFVAVMVAT
jgi:hypothetical protein